MGAKELTKMEREPARIRIVLMKIVIKEIKKLRKLRIGATIKRRRKKEIRKDKKKNNKR